MSFNQNLWVAYNVRDGKRVAGSLNRGELDRAIGVCQALVDRGHWDGFTCGVNIINPQYVYDRVVAFGHPLVAGQHYELVEQVNDDLLRRTTPPREQWRLPHLFTPPAVAEFMSGAVLSLAGAAPQLPVPRQRGGTRLTQKYAQALEVVRGWNLENLSRETVYAALEVRGWHWNGRFWADVSGLEVSA